MKKETVLLFNPYLIQKKIKDRKKMFKEVRIFKLQKFKKGFLIQNKDSLVEKRHFCVLKDYNTGFLDLNPGHIHLLCHPKDERS